MTEIEMKTSINQILEDIEGMSDLQIDKFCDERGYNILMLAAEVGNLEAVIQLIDRGLNVNYKVDGKTSADLAFANGHHEVVLELLKANSLMPADFTTQKEEINVSEALKNFIRSNSELHEQIKNDDKESLMKTLTENSKPRHFFDPENNSLLRTAITNAKFSFIEMLIKNNIFLGPHESLEDIMSFLSRNEKKNLRELFLQLSPHLFSETMMILMRNCHLGPDSQNHPEYMTNVSKAFHLLLENPQTAIILRIVAATRDFILVFDFNRDWVDFVDPTAEPYTNGLFYPSGRIYIAANNILDPDRATEICSVIIHELCHYAMFLTFKNEGKPYYKKDPRDEQIFAKVCEKCEKNKETEDIIDLVYDCYTEEYQHAELIVRVPQIITCYHDQPQKLIEKKEIFSELFNYYQNTVVTQMEAELPRIEKEFRPEYERKVRIQRKWIFFLTICFFLSLIFAVLIGIWLYTPTYVWSEMTKEQKEIVKMTNVTYKDKHVKFGELFANNSTVYDSLLSEHIRNALDGENLKLSEAIESFYEKFIFLSWSNMSENLREKLFYSKVNFQGESVGLNEIVTIYSALDFLTTADVKLILNNQTFNISSPVEIKAKFVIDRFFILESSDVHPVMRSHFQKSFDDVIYDTQFSKIFLLSDKAGEGKSVTFRNFARKSKQSYPTKWVQYFDLKKFVHTFESGKLLNFTKPENLTLFLSEKLLDLKNFEKKLFIDQYRNDKVIFIYDGVDEVSPVFFDLLMNLFANVTEQTKNFQFISTRPQHSLDIQTRLKVKAYKFVELTKMERWQFFIKFVGSEIDGLNQTCEESLLDITQIDHSKCPENIINAVEKGKNLFAQIENSPQSAQLVRNPLLIEMVAEIATQENFKVTSDLNIYSIYENFIQKKFEIFSEKGGVILDEHNKNLAKSSVSIMGVHQAYALKLLFAKLEFKTHKLIPKLSAEAVSRYGIVIVISNNDFDFVHRTFAEFLVAQFLIDKMDDLKKGSSETKSRITLFNEILIDQNNEIVKKFLLNYVQTEGKLSPIWEILRDLIGKFEELAEKLQSQYVNTDVIIFFTFKKYSYFFANQYNISAHEHQLNFDRKTYEFPIDFYLENWGVIEEIFGINFSKFCLMTRNYDDRTLLSLLTDENIENYLKFLKSKLTRDELKILIFTRNRKDETTFLTSETEPYLNVDSVKVLWKFIEENLNLEEQKKLLLIKNMQSLLLKRSMYDKNRIFFTFFTELYVRLLTLRGVRDIYLNIKDKYLFFFILFDYTHHDKLYVFRDAFQFMENIFEGDKLEFRKFLSHFCNNDSALFQSFRDDNYKNKIAIFVEFMRRTFEENEQKEYEDYVWKLEEDCRDSIGWPEPYRSIAGSFLPNKRNSTEA